MFFRVMIDLKDEALAEEVADAIVLKLATLKTGGEWNHPVDDNATVLVVPCDGEPD